VVSISILSHTIAKLSFKAKSHAKIAELLENGALLEKYPIIFNSDPTHMVDTITRNRSQVPLNPLNTLDFSIIIYRIVIGCN
jgi:hypothetical protein